MQNVLFPQKGCKIVLQIPLRKGTRPEEIISKGGHLIEVGNGENYQCRPNIVLILKSVIPTGDLASFSRHTGKAPVSVNLPELPTSKIPRNLKSVTVTITYSGSKKRGILEGFFCKNVRLSWLWRSECQAYCWEYFCFLGRDTGLYRNPLC